LNPFHRSNRSSMAKITHHPQDHGQSRHLAVDIGLPLGFLESRRAGTQVTS
jgi:hypothetical protein